ncbi:DNA alkylation repair protein [Catenulispora subtropica]|uniref:DNA alkylation repair protein n=1 Tax=Catenulispora subtropica TaxID=450798 RepID=A0ABP5EDN6_9ACTN
MTDATTTPIPALVSGFDKDLDGLGTAARATHDQQYHKSEFAHMGVPVPELRKLVKGLYKELGGRRAGHDDVTGLAAALWDSDVYERRLAAVFVLAQGVRLLDGADLQDVTLMLRDAPMWSLVDPLAGDVAGKVVLRDREGTGRTLDLWADDGDFWLRRAALLALIPGIREGKPDLVRFTRYADPMVEEREFFIRKAIGWVLREIAYKDPTWVAAWVTARLDRLSGVTFREAVRRLPEDMAARLTAEYKAAGSGRGAGKAVARSAA